MKKVMLLLFALLCILGMTCTAYGATFTADYSSNGIFTDSFSDARTHAQVNMDSGPDVIAPLIIRSSDFPGFHTVGGSLFEIKVGQAGNQNNSTVETWGLYFDNDNTDGTAASLIQQLSLSYDASLSPRNYWVDDSAPGSYDLSGSDWEFRIYHITSPTSGVGIKISDLTISNVPIPSALWLLGSGLLGLVGFRRKFRNV